MPTVRTTTPKRTDSQVLIRIDAELRRRLKMAAASEGISMQEMARRVIRAGLNGSPHAAKSA